MSSPPRPLASGQRESVLQRRLTLKEMLDAPTFTEVVRSFVELYKIGIKVLDEKGAKLADIKIGNGDFCGYVFSFAEGRQRCTATVARVKDGKVSPGDGACRPSAQDGAPAGLVAVPCFTGLRYLVMPVIWEGDPLGRIIFGPFVPDERSEMDASLQALGSNFDSAHATVLREKIRKAPEAAVVRVMAHFSQLVESLVAAGQKTFLTTQLHIEATLETNRDLEAQNQKLEALNARLKELDRLKSSFLATVSHELRTPLTSIIGYSEMMSEGLAGAMTGEQVDYVNTIREKGETLLKLITSILDISQIEAGKVRLNFEPLELAELLLSAVTSVKPQARKRGVEVELKLPAQQLKVSADRERLRQVVVNLLANAVKFTPRGGKVSLLLSEVAHQPEIASDGYRIVTEDSGVGIPNDQFDKIFQSFYQVDSSSTREFGGAGLGLAIVKSFVEGHGGQVRVSSELGRGSRFTAILPALPSKLKTVQIAAPIAGELPLERF